MSKLYRFFRSVRLAVVLLLVITGLSILATLIPQGRGEEYYRTSYAPGMADLILWTGFDGFSTSVLFLAPVALFVVNLGVCTVHRMTTRGKSGAARRHGPDLIHIGLLILAVGGVASTLLRKEAAFSMGAGDSVDVSGGYRLELLAFDTQRYESGLPKDWISTVRVTQGDKVLPDHLRDGGGPSPERRLRRQLHSAERRGRAGRRVGAFPCRGGARRGRGLPRAIRGVEG
jgi:cytochrome c biogenesis protein ResB